MAISDEIQKLEAFRTSGILTDEEFAKAKATVLAGDSPTAATGDSTKTPNGGRNRFPWKLVFFLALVGILFSTNPDEAVFQRDLKAKDDRGPWAKAVGDALTEVKFTRTNYYLISIGTLRFQGRIRGDFEEMEIVGAFGRWWFDYPLRRAWSTRL